MGYAVYEDMHADRFAGYGVPAQCDYVGCTTQIDRGLAYKCEEAVTYRYYREGKEVEPPLPGEFWDDVSEQEEIEEGCGMFFCGLHRFHEEHEKNSHPSADIEMWERHMLSDETWQPWRDENPNKVREMEQRYGVDS